MNHLLTIFDKTPYKEKPTSSAAGLTAKHNAVTDGTAGVSLLKDPVILQDSLA